MGQNVRFSQCCSCCVEFMLRLQEQILIRDFKLFTIVCLRNVLKYFTVTRSNIAENVNFQDIIDVSLPTD